MMDSFLPHNNMVAQNQTSEITAFSAWYDVNCDATFLSIFLKFIYEMSV